MPFVMDCSVTMPWLLRNDQSGYSEQVLKSLISENAIVPDLWRLEVSNVLLVFERRKRITQGETERFLKLVAELPIISDKGAADRVFSKILELGRKHRLSAYGATYLELAMRQKLALATLDETLRSAARKAKVKLFRAT